MELAKLSINLIKKSKLLYFNYFFIKMRGSLGKIVLIKKLIILITSNFEILMQKSSI